MKCGIGTVNGCNFKTPMEACGKARKELKEIIDKNELNHSVLYWMTMAPDPPKKDQVFWYYAGFIFDSNKINGINELKKYENTSQSIIAIKIENTKGDWYVYQVCGSHKQLRTAWGDAMKDLKQRGHKIAWGGQCHEVYLNQQSEGVQEKDLVTLIHFPLDS